MNAKRLLDISEAAEILQFSVAKVRQMVIGDRTLAAVHENYRGFRAPFELRGLQLFDVDDLGAITDIRTQKPAGWLRFDLAEVVRVLSERGHIGAAVVPLSDLISPALGVAVGASGGVEPDKAGPPPLQRTAAQDSAILCEIEKLGYDPLALPKNLPGKAGVKAAIRTALSKNPLFAGGTVFDKAWERLTARADIAIQG